MNCNICKHTQREHKAWGVDRTGVPIIWGCLECRVTCQIFNAYLMERADIRDTLADYKQIDPNEIGMN